MQVVIPVKSLARAKARLSSVLEDKERENLARYMLEDVLRALCESVEVTQISIVGSDKQLNAIAETSAFQVVPDTAGNLNGALGEALTLLMAGGTTELLIMHADIPLVTGAAIDNFIRQHREGLCQKLDEAAVSLVPAEADGGTNALILSPPDVVPLVFGADSCRRFRESATGRGIDVQFFQSTEVSLDIDTPDDLQSLLKILGDQTGHKTRTQVYLESIGIDRRLSGELDLPGVAGEVETGQAEARKTETRGLRKELGNTGSLSLPTEQAL